MLLVSSKGHDILRAIHTGVGWVWLARPSIFIHSEESVDTCSHNQGKCVLTGTDPRLSLSCHHMQGEPGTQSYVLTIIPPHTYKHCTEGDIRDPHARRAVALMDRADLEDKQLKLMEENQVWPFCFPRPSPSLTTCIPYKYSMSTVPSYTTAHVNLCLCSC